MKTMRAHPLQIVRNMGRGLYLLPLPLGNAALLAWRGELAQWEVVVRQDLLILAVLLLISVYEWLKYTISISEKGVILEYGILGRVKKVIPREKMVLIKTTQSIVQRWTNTCDVWVYHAGGQKHTCRIRSLPEKVVRELLAASA